MEKDWWKGKVAYQIYPKSFKDSNGDGVGDLKGITEKLDYLQDLGIDILWLSPVYKSPFIDQGYDISDYYAIDPLFGTMEDMEELIAEGKKRGISIIMDLVVNHCSSHHEWFQKALADPDGPYADYFYFIESDKEPNNWESYFGGSVWEPVPGTNKYYLHSFHKDQPDLNWQNPVLREEIYKMINWWLDKGIAGFRIDAIINIKKDLEWRSLPSDRDNGLVPVPESLVNAQPIEPFLQETVSSLPSLTSNKPCWGKKEKAGLTIVFRQQMNSRKVFSKLMSVQIVLGSSRPLSKITMSLVGCPIILQKVQ